MKRNGHQVLTLTLVTVCLAATIATAAEPSRLDVKQAAPRHGVAAIANVPCGDVVPSDWELVFSDEFEGTALDTSEWQLLGNDSLRDVNGAKARERLETVKLDGAGHAVFPCEPDVQGVWRWVQFLRTRQEWTYGYFESRIRMGAEPSLISSGFWLYNLPQGNPVTQHIELDILENQNLKMNHTFSWPADPPTGTKVVNGVPTPGNVGPTVRFNGRDTRVEAPAPPVSDAITVAAWLQIRSIADANFILSVGPWNRGYSLGLANGRPRWTIGKDSGGTGIVDKALEAAKGDANRVHLDATDSLALRKWVHVAATFDGDCRRRRMRVYVDGVLKASSGEADGTVGAGSATCAFTRRADPWPGSREVAVVTRVLGGNVASDGEAAWKHSLNRANRSSSPRSSRAISM